MADSPICYSFAGDVLSTLAPTPSSTPAPATAKPAVKSATKPAVKAAPDSGKKERKEKFIPYKNSKLTHYLKDSLGGNARSYFFVHLRPEPEYQLQASTVLMYANWAKTVVSHVTRATFTLGADMDKEDDPEVERLK